MAILKLSKGYAALIDDDQLAKIGSMSWCASFTKSGAVYAKSTIKRKGVYLHRFLMDAWTGVQVDHKNGNTLDCRLENLRFATNQKNSANQRKRRGSSQYKGVHWSNMAKCWVASIHVGYGTQFLGHFDCERDAALAYDIAAVDAYGEFARTNFEVTSAGRAVQPARRR